MFDVIAAFWLYFTYLAIRERVFSPLSYNIVDLVLATSLIFRIIRYDETIPVYMLACLAAAAVMRFSSTNTPTAAQ